MRIVPATQTSYAYIEFDTEDLKRIAELADQIAARGVIRIGGPDPRDAVVAAALAYRRSFDGAKDYATFGEWAQANDVAYAALAAALEEVPEP